MAKIYKCTDRIKVKIEDVTVTLSPLSLDQKIEVQSLMSKGVAKQDQQLLTEGVVTIVKYAVKAVDGIEDQDGNKYKLEFENGMLTRECVSDLFNMDIQEKLIEACTKLLGPINKAFGDSNQIPEGVKVIPSQNKESESPN